MNVNEPSHYTCSKTITLRTRQNAHNVFQNVIQNIKQGKLFYGNISTNTQEREWTLGTVVSITTSVFPMVYTTSYVIVSSLTHVDHYFSLCLMCVDVNIVEGFYHVDIYLQDNRVHITLVNKHNIKSMSLLFILSSKTIEDSNNESTTNTVHGLFNDAMPITIDI